jgi:hypothetical protein
VTLPHFLAFNKTRYILLAANDVRARKQERDGLQVLHSFFVTDTQQVTEETSSVVASTSEPSEFRFAMVARMYLS